jgi:hypothetical protein
MRILCPHDGDPDRIETSTAGPPDHLQVSSVWAEWPGAISISWAANRDDWPRVLDAMQALAAEPLESTADSRTQQIPEGLLTTKFLPALRVTVDILDGQEHRAVLVRAGVHEAVAVRLREVDA